MKKLLLGLELLQQTDEAVVAPEVEENGVDGEGNEVVADDVDGEGNEVVDGEGNEVVADDATEGE